MTINHVSTIVLNYRTPDMTIDCLVSLARQYEEYPHFDVVLIDNASGDDSVPRIREAMEKHSEWNAWLSFLVMETNLGFAGGNAYGVDWLREQNRLPEFVLLLNSDTLVDDGCFKYCVKVMKDQPGVGLMSCMLHNRDGSVQNIARLFPRPDRETVRALGWAYAWPKLFDWADIEDGKWDRKAGPRDVEWIGGAFMMIRREVLDAMGCLDPTFFFYGEDIEFCYRVHKAGWRVYFDPAVAITHFGGGSSDTSRLHDRRRDELRWKGRFLVQRKCYGVLAEWWVHGVYLFAFALRLLWMRLTGRRDSVEYGKIAGGLSVLLGRKS
ncbi:MAG: glycosyltransferase family 2 protein [Spartobacteria bacterium]|nr:glycosyltransferase family 2 protein [Spartobacteria bacterium]